MTFEVRCPKCGKTANVHESFLDREIVCLSCSNEYKPILSESTAAIPSRWTIRCPKCRSCAELTQEALGKVVSCPICQQPLFVRRGNGVSTPDDAQVGQGVVPLSAQRPPSTDHNTIDIVVPSPKDKKGKLVWGWLACIIAWLFAIGGFCSLYGYFYDTTHGQPLPIPPKGPAELVGYICGGMMVWGLGLALGLSAAIGYRIVAAWPAVVLCGVWMVVSVIQTMLLAAK